MYASALPFEKLPESSIANVDPEMRTVKMDMADHGFAAERTIADDRDAGAVFGNHLITQDLRLAVERCITACARVAELEFAEETYQLCLSAGRNIFPGSDLPRCPAGVRAPCSPYS